MKHSLLILPNTRDELGIPRFNVAAIRAVMSCDLAALWLPGVASWYPLVSAQCLQCRRSVGVVAFASVTGAILDVHHNHEPPGPGLYLARHVCEVRRDRK